MDSTKSASKDFLPSLNGIRAVCILLVLGSHFPNSAGFPEALRPAVPYVANGHLGVTIFFVLSGFLITYLLAREEESQGAVSLRLFYLRRSLRILPVYFAYVLAVFVIDCLTNLNLSFQQYLTALTFTKNYWPGQWIDTHLWSLAVEEQFYLIWPLIFAKTSDRIRIGFAIALILVAPFARVFFYTQGMPGPRLFSFMANMDSLMLGSLAGWAIQRSQWFVDCICKASWPPARFFAVAAIYGVWQIEAHHKLAVLTVPFAITVQSVAAAFLIASYVLSKRGLGFALLNTAPVASLGVLSFSIYIWQQPFFDKSSSYGASDSFALLTFPVNLIAALLVAALSYHLLEQPLLRLRQRLRRGNCADKNNRSFFVAPN